MSFNITAETTNQFVGKELCNMEEIYNDWEAFQRGCTLFKSKSISKYIKLYDLFRDFKTAKAIEKTQICI